MDGGAGRGYCVEADLFAFYAHYNLGHLSASLNNLPQALEHYRAAIQLLEQERAVLSQMEVFERRYAAERRDVYRLAAEAAFRLDRPLEALEMLEQGQARWLARQIARREAIPPTVPEELRARYDRTFQAVQFLRSIVYGEPAWGERAIEEAQRGMKLLDKAQTEEEFKRMIAGGQGAGTARLPAGPGRCRGRTGAGHPGDPPLCAQLRCPS